MDDVDLTLEREERMAELARRYTRTTPQLVPTGFCLNCEEPIDDDRRFCDAACRDDAAKRERMKGIAGSRPADD